MNDRFRFRAWNVCDDGLKGGMHYDVQNDTEFGYFLGSKKWIVEQCTGLKDKSGKLIYEGDLLLLNPDDPLALVVWEEDVAMFCLQQEDWVYTFDNCGYAPREMEIVGNIHENPELLEGARC